MSFPYKDYNIKSIKKEDKELYLESTYNLCVQELGLQQTKRDQIIAFYIAIISFAVPGIIGLSITNVGKAIGFIAIYILGVMLTKVIMRYRIYKEVYWVTCKTLTQLYSIDTDKINKAVVQHIFYITLQKNSSSVIILKDKKKGEKKEVDVYKSFKKILNSAETILYQILVLISSLSLFIGVYLFIQMELIGISVAIVIVSANVIYWHSYYYKNLTKIYDVIVDEKDDSFNSVFNKAWFLHSYIE